ncbi:signal transduction histidine kinase [Kibdelosporangium banguiense]|uniref:Signal transduction histidine kinase n=1 Tax=Kibdelosporangium banguiense TaxID=1365924 RepID=A0ABS4TLW5_9PSEU|nr:ATP-binding protein [Kibdelosporangium banguiense]MBP2325417.1 signal transduction histidine kinase [Kibdelosporangium banguiense]
MGSAERELLRTGLRYALGLRLTVVALASLVSLLLEPAREPVLTALVIVALNGWNAWYAYRKVRDDGMWLIVADVAVMAGVCLTQVWTSGPGTTAESSSWVLVAVSITVVTYPWQQNLPTLMVSTVVLMTAFLFGAAFARPDEWLAAAPVQLWMLVEPGLSYGLYRLVRHGARSADLLVARNEQIRREATIADARRADEREYLAALHDTASATLLMVGAGVVAKPERWLAEQAARDLEVIRGREDIPAGEVDLLEMLREVSGRTPLTVRWKVPESLTVLAVVGIALSRGTREALTNVVRHSGVSEAFIRVHRKGDTVSVEISDEGAGFDAAAVPENRYGVARSLVERMARIGGHAEVDSKPGDGTRVRLESPVTVGDSGGRDAELIASRFHWGLRWAVVVMNLIILYGLDLPKLLSGQDAYSSVTMQFVALGVFTLVSPWVAFTMWRGITSTWWRWPLVVVLFVVAILATQTVLPEYRLGVPHWSEGDAAWSLAALMITESLFVYAGLIIAQYALTFVQVAIGGSSAATFVGVVNATLNSLGYLLAVGMIAMVLRGIAVSAAKIARDEEDLRTSEAVANQLHNDRRDRYAVVADTTAPLLAGLASGDLDPGDEDVRRRCSLDAAKMRRLFAEGASDPLLHELRGCIELAERNGVSVRFAERGQRPTVPKEARRVLTEPAVAMLATAVSVARVTVVGTGDSVTVSVVSDSPADSVPEIGHDGITASTVRSGGQLWVEVTWMRGE